VSDPSNEGRRWLLVRQGPLAPEERGVLAAVRRRLSADQRDPVTVLLGSSCYDVDIPMSGTEDRGEEWLLEEEARGRGIERLVGRRWRTVTPEELVAAIMSAERVIQFP